jgi:hypothetical protein
MYSNKFFNNGKQCFGNLKTLDNTSDYLQKKKRRLVNFNYDAKYKDTYDFYYLNRHNVPMKQLNTTNLIYNLYSKENLQNVNVLTNKNSGQVNPYINPSLGPFYKYYKIDPLGQLFGNSQCGINNYVHYMEPDCLCLGHSFI